MAKDLDLRIIYLSFCNIDSQIWDRKFTGCSMCVEFRSILNIIVLHELVNCSRILNRKLFGWKKIGLWLLNLQLSE